MFQHLYMQIRWQINFNLDKNSLNSFCLHSLIMHTNLCITYQILLYQLIFAWLYLDCLHILLHATTSNTTFSKKKQFLVQTYKEY